MSNPLVDYEHLGQWTSRIPPYCAHPTRAHPLVSGRMLNGWAECSCGGHRTVQCLAYQDGHQCRAVHHLPALTATCSLWPMPRPIPRQRRG